MSKENHARFKEMLKYFKITKEDVAKITGLTYSHIRDSTVPQNFSKWARFTLWVFEFMLDKIEKE